MISSIHMTKIENTMNFKLLSDIQQKQRLVMFILKIIINRKII